MDTNYDLIKNPFDLPPDKELFASIARETKKVKIEQQENMKKALKTALSQIQEAI